MESGKVTDIYEKDGDIRFNDKDDDMYVSTNDNFDLEGINNGGKCASEYKFIMKYSENNKVVMSDEAP